MIFMLWRLTAYFSSLLRTLNACFSGPLRRLTAYFSTPFSLTFSAISANLGVKGGQLEFLNLFTVFRKVISFIFEILFQVDRVPLKIPTKLGGEIDAIIGIQYKNIYPKKRRKRKTELENLEITLKGWNIRGEYFTLFPNKIFGKSFHLLVFWGRVSSFLPMF